MACLPACVGRRRHRMHTSCGGAALGQHWLPGASARLGRHASIRAPHVRSVPWFKLRHFILSSRFDEARRSPIWYVHAAESHATLPRTQQVRFDGSVCLRLITDLSWALAAPAPLTRSTDAMRRSIFLSHMLFGALYTQRCYRVDTLCSNINCSNIYAPRVVRAPCGFGPIAPRLHCPFTRDHVRVRYKKNSCEATQNGGQRACPVCRDGAP